MTAKLYLKFFDQNQRQQIVEVDAAQFTIGRTPDSDLQILNSNLSRHHARIERFGNVFVLSDLSSSNGTTLNNQNLTKPAALKNNDQISLGQAVLLNVELINNQAIEVSINQFSAESEFSANNFLYPSNDRAPKPFWRNIFLLAPLLGVLVVAFTIVLFFVFADNNRNSKTGVTRVNDDASEDDAENRRVRSKVEQSKNVDEDDSKTIVDNQKNVNPSSDAAASNLADREATNNANDETERLARQFLRAVSSDPNPVLTSKQIAAINAKLKTYQDSFAVRENLRVVKRNAVNFEQLASAHNLNSKFLMAAVLAKLDQTRGDPLATAAAIAPDLRKYGNVLGFELANDCLLVAAAYSEDNSPLVMRDKVANLAKQTSSASVATIRTIWFLRENNKITESAYDFALRLLALGTMIEEND